MTGSVPDGGRGGEPAPDGADADVPATGRSVMDGSATGASADDGGAVRGGGPRLAPLPRAALSVPARLVVSVLGRATGGEPPHVFTTLLRHRRLFWRWLPFGGWLLLRTELPRADVELVILRTACNTGSVYEWCQHVALARRAGLDDAAIAAVADWPSSPRWTARQRALLGAADELHEDNRLTDATWAALCRELDEHERIELCFLVGHYTMVAMALNSLRVEPEATTVARIGPVAAAIAESLASSARSQGRRQASPS
jgi:alkylhydroperoxidase family enzyme